MRASFVLFFVFLVAVAFVCGAIATPLTVAKERVETGASSWRPVHRWLEEQRDRLSEDLETAHAALLPRAEADAALLARLSPEPERPLPRGYRILPEIRDDEPPVRVEPKRTVYSLERLSSGFAGDFRDAAILAGRAFAEPDLSLEPLVAEFERLRGRMRTLDEHVAYHAYWQRAVADQTDYFDERNRVIALVGRMQSLREEGQIRAADDLLRTIRDRIAPFRRTRGLEIDARGDKTLRLPVTVWTDIEDDAFLAAFGEAVETVYNRSEAARAKKIRVELSWSRITPDELYPDGAPARGAGIDMQDHLARFPSGALVLTTGEDSTHAWTGKNILLGPNAMTRRTLAHEFGHLLGFSDAYLRGYEGDPRGSFGAVLVEWTGLVADLMGNPSGGRVSGEMIQTLIDAYRKP